MLRSRGKTPLCFAISPTNDLLYYAWELQYQIVPLLYDITHQCIAGKKLKTQISLVYRMHSDIILRAGTSIYAANKWYETMTHLCVI